MPQTRRSLKIRSEKQIQKKHTQIFLLSAHVAPHVRMHGGPAGCGCLTERNPVSAAIRRSRHRYRPNHLDGQRPIIGCRYNRTSATCRFALKLKHHSGQHHEKGKHLASSKQAERSRAWPCWWCRLTIGKRTTGSSVWPYNYPDSEPLSCLSPT